MDIHRVEVGESALQHEVTAVSALDAVPTILEILCRTTGMGFAAVARVTEDRWIACAVKDDIDFGLKAGGELPVATTFCNQIRGDGRRIVIDHVAQDVVFKTHMTPAMYGFQSWAVVSRCNVAIASHWSLSFNKSLASCNTLGPIGESKPASTIWVRYIAIVRALRSSCPIYLAMLSRMEAVSDPFWSRRIVTATRSISRSKIRDHLFPAQRSIDYFSHFFAHQRLQVSRAWASVYTSSLK